MRLQKISQVFKNEWQIIYEDEDDDVFLSLYDGFFNLVNYVCSLNI